MEKPEYYNEFNPDAAAWLRDLIKAGELPEGDVDERSIADLRPEDLRGYHRCHFFAGIGLWPYALRLAGFPADEPVWTGSCPCQPYSSAGKQKGEEDPRHLWPVWSRLIEECAPPVVFGEQVAAAIGKGWLDLVQSDLERKGYAVGKAVLSAASVGAPHIRQRLYFVADTQRWATERHGLSVGRETAGVSGEALQREWFRNDFGDVGNTGELADAGSMVWRPAEQSTSRIQDQTFGGEETADDKRCGSALNMANSEGSGGRLPIRGDSRHQVSELVRGSEVSGVALGDTGSEGLAGRWRLSGQHVPQGRYGAEGHQPTQGFWGGCDWVWCRDSRYRPVEPESFPLAHGLPLNMGSLPTELQRLAELAGLSGASLKCAKNFRKSALQGYGNAIVPQVAVEFISAYLSVRDSD